MILEERAYIVGNPHEAQLREIFGIAGVGYGRIDYAVLNGRVQTWEINLHPTIGRGPGEDRKKRVPPELEPLRDVGKAHFHRGFSAAWEAVDIPVRRKAARSDRVRSAHGLGGTVPARPPPLPARAAPGRAPAQTSARAALPSGLSASRAPGPAGSPLGLTFPGAPGGHSLRARISGDVPPPDGRGAFTPLVSDGLVARGPRRGPSARHPRSRGRRRSFRHLRRLRQTDWRPLDRGPPDDGAAAHDRLHPVGDRRSARGGRRRAPGRPRGAALRDDARRRGHSRAPAGPRDREARAGRSGDRRDPDGRHTRAGVGARDRAEPAGLHRVLDPLADSAQPLRSGGARRDPPRPALHGLPGNRDHAPSGRAARAAVPDSEGAGRGHAGRRALDPRAHSARRLRSHASLRARDRRRGGRRARGVGRDLLGAPAAVHPPALSRGRLSRADEPSRLRPRGGAGPARRRHDAVLDRVASGLSRGRPRPPGPARHGHGPGPAALRLPVQAQPDRHEHDEVHLPGPRLRGGPRSGQDRWPS